MSPRSGRLKPDGSLTDAAQRRRVLQVAMGLSASLGAEFFRSVVTHLAVALRADCVYLAELTDSLAGRMRTVAVFQDGQHSSNFEHSLIGTANQQVLDVGSFVCDKNVRRSFPLDTVLEGFAAEGYVGVRLSDSAGQPSGLLALIFKKRVTNAALAKAVLETFVPRAAAELERKRSDDLHKESEERYHAFVASNPDAMWRFEFEQPVPLNQTEEQQIEQIYRFGYLAECNDAMAALAGVARAGQLLGARFADLCPQSDERIVRELKSAVRSGFRNTIVETTFEDEFGRRQFRLRSQFGIVEDGALRRLWGSTRDITELKQAELSLAASERRFGEVLEGIQVPALILDSNGAVTFSNDCVLRLTQRSAEELRERAWLDGVVPAEETATWQAALRPVASSQRDSHHFEGSLIPLNGPPHVIQWDTICLRDADKKVTALAAIGRDVTHERALEAEIRESQKLEGIGRLAGGIAHDFNNLLAVIVGYTSQLKKGAAESSPAHAQLSAVERAATQCTALTGQLLAVARKQHLQPKRISLSEVIAAEEGLIRMLLGEDTELVLKLAPHLAEVNVDPLQIQRALANLVTNARDAMPLGGTLTIATSNVTLDEHSAERNSSVKPGAYVQLSVTDTGSGFTEETRTHIFEPFFTTKAPGKGTGLGLSTVYGIVVQSGGHISVSSVPNKATSFEILLPASPEDPPC